MRIFLRKPESNGMKRTPGSPHGTGRNQRMKPLGVSISTGFLPLLNCIGRPMGRNGTESHTDLPFPPSPDSPLSPAWAAIRGRILARAGQRCQTCHSPHALEVHHRRYGAWGHEDDADLICLCAECHTLFTAWQARRAEIIAELEERMNEQICNTCRNFVENGKIENQEEYWRLKPAV